MNMPAHLCYMIPLSAIYQNFFESFFDSYATEADPDQTMCKHRLIWIYTGHKCPNVGFLGLALILVIDGGKLVEDKLLYYPEHWNLIQLQDSITINLSLTSDRPKVAFFLCNLHITDWIQHSCLSNTEFALIPESVIKRLWCTCKWTSD